MTEFLTDDWTWALEGLTFGCNSDIIVKKIDRPKPGVRAGDKERPTADGVLFGRDWHEGTEMTLELQILSPDDDAGDALDMLEQLQSRWYGDDHRNLTGAVTELQYKMPGRDARKFYGRPREFEPTDSMENLRFGIATVMATFQCVDGYSYGVDKSIDVKLRFGSTGGIAPPITPPLNIQSYSDVQSGIVFIDGTRPTWCDGTILGPCSNPRIELVDKWYLQFDITLGDLDFITLHGKPWDQERYGPALLNGVTNIAGKTRRGSVKLSELILPAGPVEFVYSAQDFTGNSKFVPLWSPKYTSL